MSRKRDEPVRLTRIYTRGGDAGETSLGGGSRGPKTDARIEAVGGVDEVESPVGRARAIAGAGPLVAVTLNRLSHLLVIPPPAPTAPAGELLWKPGESPRP